MTTSRACLGLALLSLAACASPSRPRAIHVEAASPDSLSAPLLAAVETPAAPAVLAAQSADDGPGLDSLIDPVSAPLTFESPLIHTSVRPLYIYHTFPKTGFFKGGLLRAYAAQVRWAITEDIQFIATQDGKAELRGTALPDQSGSIDLEAGFKFKVFEDEDTIVSAGFVYQAANGDDEVFQGNGNGMWRPFISGGWVGEPVNLIANAGLNLPVDGDDESTSIDAHLHISPSGDSAIVPLAEFNLIHYISSGNVLPVNFEGVDYANLGSTNVTGNTILTGALGARWRAIETGSLGVSWETPLSNRKDIFDSRWTFDWMQRF